MTGQTLGVKVVLNVADLAMDIAEGSAVYRSWVWRNCSVMGRELIITRYGRKHSASCRASRHLGRICANPKENDVMIKPALSQCSTEIPLGLRA